jgi:hypothetical protein
MDFAEQSFSYDKLQIIKDDVEYTLPERWALTDAGAFTFNNSLQTRAFAHGSDMIGDGKIAGRTIKIEFSMRGTTEQEHDELLNQAYTYFSMTDYELRVGRSDRVFKVAGLSKIAHKYQSSFKQRMSIITVSLLLADPFRYEANESKVAYSFSKGATEAEMIVHNLGNVDTPLTFRFVPDSKMPEVTIWHQEAQEKFVMTDALLSKPAISIVNGKTGTVWRDNGNAINTFSGQFLHAKPGANLYLYTGGAGTIEITFTNRWFI